MRREPRTELRHAGNGDEAMTATTRDPRSEASVLNGSPARLDAEAIRRDFPIFAARSEEGHPLTFLDTGASAQKPKVVIDREVEVYSRSYANAYRGVYQ